MILVPFRWLYARLLLLVQSLPWIASRDDTIQRLRIALGDKDKHLERLTREHLSTTSKIQSLEKDLLSTRTAVQKGERELRRVEGEKRGLQARVATLEASGREQALEIEQLRREVAHAKKKQRGTDELLQTRTTELRNAQTYLGLIDDVAESEVVQLVEHLNGQIFQVAATLVDAPEFLYDGPHDVAAIEGARGRLAQASLLAPDLLSSLWVPGRGQDPVWGQLALQAAMSTYAQQLGNGWDISAVEHPSQLKQVYLTLRQIEPQPVAGRWRMLARKHIKALQPTSWSTRALFDTLASHLTDVLIVCGAIGAREDLLETVAREFKSEVQDVLRRVLDFHRTAGERVVSCDFALVAAEPGVTFDPSLMEEEKGIRLQGPNPVAARVLCAAEVGLVAERRSDETAPQDANAGTRILKRCKVVLGEPRVKGESLQRDVAGESTTPDVYLAPGNDLDELEVTSSITNDPFSDMNIELELEASDAIEPQAILPSPHEIGRKEVNLDKGTRR
ncbi:hypothetical protein C8Q76DRAFT_787401, partial [Earliella scabrosa]